MEESFGGADASPPQQTNKQYLRQHNMCNTELLYVLYDILVILVTHFCTFNCLQSPRTNYDFEGKFGVFHCYGYFSPVLKGISKSLAKLYSFC